MTTLEKLSGAVYSGRMVTLARIGTEFSVRRGVLHFYRSDFRFAFICDGDEVTVFTAADVRAIDRVGARITLGAA